VLGIAVLVGGPVNVAVQTLAPSGLFRISGPTLTEAAHQDARVAWAVAEELSQQELADAVGSVREVVARVLRDLRLAGIVATAPDTVVVVDAARLQRESWEPTAE
jgi:CRP/FNR family transcriptional regulator, cyclic AMP receptor protein